MSKPSQTEMEQEKEIGSIVQQFVYRLPKKNHEAMIQLEKQFIDIFRKHGGLHYEIFQLSSTGNVMDWINISKTMSQIKILFLQIYVSLFYMDRLDYLMLLSEVIAY